MDQAWQFLETALALLWQAIGFVIGIIAQVEAWLRLHMGQLGISPALQTVVLIVGTLLLMLAVLRLLGWALRILLLLFLVALAVQAFGPARRSRAPVHHTQAVERQAAGTPLVVEYSKCSATSGCTIG